MKCLEEANIQRQTDWWLTGAWLTVNGHEGTLGGDGKVVKLNCDDGCPTL